MTHVRTLNATLYSISDVENLPGYSAFRDLLDRAQKLLSDTPDIVVQTRVTHRLVDAVLAASAEVALDTVIVKGGAVQRLGTSIATKTVPGVGLIGDSTLWEYAFRVRPRPAFAPAVSIGLYGIPDAQFPTFGVTGSPPDQDLVITGSQDHRVVWGLSLGVTSRWYGLDDPRKAAIWFPELMVAPSSTVRALGIGASISLFGVKLGLGIATVRRDVVDMTKPVSELVDATGKVRTDSRYSNPLFYVNFSVIGWPPFVPS